MEVVTREEWGARPRDGGADTPYDPVGVALHWAGGGWPWPWPHGTCDDKLRAIQDDYMDGRGYSDIGYNYAVCPHTGPSGGRVYVARGDRRNAANGGTGNANGTHCAILGLWGTRSGEPVPGLLNAYRDAIDYVRTRGVGTEITGHRDHTATECPGDDIYAWLRAGAHRVEDDMQLTDPVDIEGWAEKTLGMDHMTVKALLGYAAAGGWLQRRVLARLDRMLAQQAALVAAVAAIQGGTTDPAMVQAAAAAGAAEALAELELTGTVTVTGDPDTV